ncbi:poly(U)-specific endoribonuclease-B-like isoform X2 [Gigantopelta aegis]|uniref:poly(U)-specific endoribonuclease-B-like isoform X2 n=1 Tax=Gigantopelta aegis TaxID=1735272 RepID=UPI001B888137|nr:poly(U)-specific endoribonuclease-B-like isoform X2 [Gigantopelta aegis]
MELSFTPDPDLSEQLTKLWELDTNKCFPGVDYELDLQGYVTSTRNVSRDYAYDKLFYWVDEENVFERPTYKAFKNLLDNYELEIGTIENVTFEEKKENWAFLDAIMETPVMQETHKYLVSKADVSEDESDFKKLLHDIWFRMFRKKGCRGNDSCSFEHVFVGEGRGEEFIGLHNWIKFYLEEKVGNINYHGYFRRETVKDDDVPRLLAVQFDWKGIKGKPLCSIFIGTSPEFEIAAYTTSLLLGKDDGSTDIQLGEYEIELTCHSFGYHRKKLGTAFITAARI